MGDNKRWKKRPENSTWGDYGPDDQLGRMNELTPAKVKQGIAEVKEGKTFCLSMPLDYPGGNVLNPRRHPPQIRPTVRGDKPNWLYRTEWENPGMTDVINDDVVIMHLQYSTQWDTLAHVGALFDANGTGKAEPTFYNGYRGGIDLVGPSDAKDAGAIPGTFVEAKGTSSAKALGVENMAVKCLQGRAVMIDLFAHYGRKRHAVGYDDLMRIMAADGIKVEAGDFVLLRTGFDEVILEGKQEARQAHAGNQLHRARRQRRAPAAVDHRDQAGGADLRQLCRRDAQQSLAARPMRHAAAAPALPVQDRRQPGRDLAAVGAGRLAARQQPQPLPAHRPAARLPGAVGSPATPVATV